MKKKQAPINHKTTSHHRAKQRKVAAVVCTGIVIAAIIGLIVVQLSLTIADTQGWTDYDIGTGSPDVYRYVQGLAIDDQGRVWAATAGKGLKTITLDGQVTTYTTANSELTNDNLSAIAIDTQGRIWVGYSGGLDMLAPDGNWTSYILESSNDSFDFFAKQVTAVAFDNQGRVWAATAGKGLKMIMPDGQVTTYTTANGITALAIDKDGQAWVGIFGSGLSVLELDGSWKSYTPENSGLLHAYVSALAIDKEGQVWIGGVDGISMLSPDGSWKTYTKYGGYNREEVIALTIDNQDRVWIGNLFGISVLIANNQWISYDHIPPDNLGLEYSLGGLALTVDRQGRAWVGNFGGLSMLDTGAGVPKQTIDLLATVRVALIGLSLITFALLLIILDQADLMPNGMIGGIVSGFGLEYLLMPGVTDKEIGMIGRFVVGFGGWLGLNVLLGLLILIMQASGKPCLGGGGLCGFVEALLSIFLVGVCNGSILIYVIVRVVINMIKKSHHTKSKSH